VAQSKNTQKEAQEESMKKKSTQSNSQLDIEWENRRLCSDESCIGVIGPDGRCKECGLPYDAETSTTESEPLFAEDMDDEEAEEFEEDSDDEIPMTKTELDMEWENRKLCSDESCIGVVGPDGRCKECGKPYVS
jgi:hypothetical protein